MLSLQHSDSTRTLHIHSDIKAHKALTGATDVYNLFYRLTAGIKNQTLMIERERFKTLLAFRLEMEKVRKEHGFKVAMAELNWRELKEKFDLQRRQRMEIEMQMVSAAVMSDRAPSSLSCAPFPHIPKDI